MPRRNGRRPSTSGRPGRNRSQRAAKELAFDPDRDNLGKGHGYRPRPAVKYSGRREPGAARPPASVVICPSGKRGMPEARARQLLEQYRADPRRKVKPVRVYLCPKCGGWHLTAQPAPGVSRGG